MMSSLIVYDIAEREHTRLTSDRFMDADPAFSADGNWLFFASTRTWNSSVGSPWGERAPQPHFENRSKIYALPLREGLVFPNAEPNELTATSASDRAFVDQCLRDLGYKTIGWD